jgi:hypothetical protein
MAKVHYYSRGFMQNLLKLSATVREMLITAAAGVLRFLQVNVSHNQALWIHKPSGKVFITDTNGRGIQRHNPTDVKLKKRAGL